MKTPETLLNDRLSRRLSQLDTMAETIRHFLSIPNSSRVWPLIRRRRLVLLTDDVMLATQIRYQQQALCQHLNQTFNLTLTAVDIKLTSLPMASNEQKKGRTRAAPQTIDIMKSIASDIEDKELREAIHRLADSTQTKDR